MGIYIIFLVWYTILGMAFGSFLNVVVWRMPRGMSLNSPASLCPKCGHHIRWRHNIPVLGWLILHGRCYDCHKPIHIRYMLVELLCGLIFLVNWLLFATIENVNKALDILPGMKNISETNFYVAAPQTIKLCLNLIFYPTLILTGLACLFILLDHQRIPLRLFIPSLACLLLMILFNLEIIFY